MRLDTLVFQRGLCESRTRAAAYIRDGRVTVDGAVVRKPSFDAPEDAAVTLDPTAPALVSRAQQKLDAAMARFALDCTGLSRAGRGRVHRRLHPLPARPRRRTRLRARRGARPASPLAAREQPRDGAGGRQRPHDDARAVSRPAGYGGDGRFVYLAIAHLSRARRRSAARQPPRHARQAPVRGGARAHRQGGS